MRSECDESRRLFSLVAAQYLLYCRVENPSRRNVGGLRIGLFNPIAEALEFPDHSGGAVSL
jgi:hypothetical protein